jgi:hypothetical protein
VFTDYPFNADMMRFLLGEAVRALAASARRSADVCHVADRRCRRGPDHGRSPFSPANGLAERQSGRRFRRSISKRWRRGRHLVDDAGLCDLSCDLGVPGVRWGDTGQ